MLTFWCQALAVAALVNVVGEIIHLEDVLMGAWEGWMRTGARLKDRGFGNGRWDLGLKGVTVAAALGWRLHLATWFFGRGPRPIAQQARHPQAWVPFLLRGSMVGTDRLNVPAIDTFSH